MIQFLMVAVAGCLFPFLMTVLGSASVFLCRGKIHPVYAQIFPGFAAGVMLAASIWSLLTPAIESAEAAGIPGWIPSALVLGGGDLFLLGADAAVLRANRRAQQEALRGGVQIPLRSRGSYLLQLAITLHNVPEGMAVGLSFALAAKAYAAEYLCMEGALAPMSLLSAGGPLAAAIGLSLGIGIQNFPEGAAVSLPLCKEGMSARRAFWRGCLSGAVEPVVGLLAIFLLGELSCVMPWLLSFAAGAMLYVVVKELIPQAAGGRDTADGHSFVGTLSVTVGFLVMMILDVALG